MRLRAYTLRIMLACASVVCHTGAAEAADGLMDQELMQLYDGTNINPFDASSTNNLALKLFRQGRYERALKLLRRAERLAPERLHIKRNREYLELLLSQMQHLDLDTAQNYSRTFADEEIPFVPDPWGQSASITDRPDQFPTTVRKEQGVSANPFDAHSLISIADIKIQRGDFRGALEDLQRAQAISPWLSGLAYRIDQIKSRVSDIGMEVEIEGSSRSELPHGSASGAVENDLPPPAAWIASSPSGQGSESAE